VGLRERVSAWLTRVGRPDAAAGDGDDDTLEVPHLDDVAILPPADAPETCPNCGERYDPARDLVAPDTGMVRLGEHSHACRIGTAHDGPLAGWTVIHR